MRIALLALTTLLVACGGAPKTASTPIGAWQTTAVADHPLVGQIWSVKDQRFITPEALVERMTTARAVLLGEKHDNPDHHRLHAWLAQQIAGAERPALFEMLDLEDADAIAAAKDSDALKAAAEWEKTGWPDFEIYRPLFDALYAAGAPVKPAHPDRKAVIGSMHKAPGPNPIYPALDQPLPAEAAAGLKDEIEKSHCGHADANMVEGMFRAQRFKDAVMGKALAGALGADGKAILVAGNGHVRTDVGVPFYVPASIDMVSLGTLEVRRGVDDPAKAAQGRAFDYVWFTPRVDEIDPCVKFAEELKRIKAMKPAAAASQPASQPAASPMVK